MGRTVTESARPSQGVGTLRLMTKVDGARQEAAARRFRVFFEELRGAFMERGDVLAQVAMALLSKEHVLLTGPPGTAKSQIASAVFGRILCEESGAPSLYSRQITESTVQTDLIGPIDFKNLTETGRTKHFTDEGMLGSVHAFLDEVFDGRDMLLRSALNVLQEREVKQGGTIAKGRIECALMTSNRYISDVLEQSRETLLAFVDRIAFIGFVPRGFSDPAHLATVLRRNVGGTGKPRLDALLTIQDLDVLQAMVDEVYVAPELCDQLALFLSRLDAELASASRADPSFTQTRYISTRTAVKCGQILRAACVFDRVFRGNSRPLSALPGDLELLRLHLLLTGPTPEQALKLVATEVNPIEKRQLAILRSEREIFEAVYRKLPPIGKLTPPVEAKPAPPPSVRFAGAAAEPATAPEKPSDPTRELARDLDRAEELRDHAAILRIAKRASELTRDDGDAVASARAVMERATRAASTLAMLAAFEVIDTKRPVLASVRAVVDLARSLEDGTTSLHKAARWTQERALELIHDVARNVAGSEASVLTRAARDNLGDPAAYTASRLETLEELATMRKQLLAESASRGLEADDAAWTAAIDEAERLLAACWGRSFVKLMVRERSSALASVLDALGPELSRLAAADDKLSRVAGRPGRLKASVVGPRLEDILIAALRTSVGQKQGSVVDQVRKLRQLLDAHGLSAAIAPVSWLSWAASALLSAEPSFGSEPRPDAYSLDGYRALRAREQRASVSCTLAEIALMVAPASADADRDPSAIVAFVMAGLDDDTKARVSAVDIARATRAVSYLAGWVAALEGKGLEAVAESRLFELLWDEAALTRFGMEARLVGEVLPHTEPLASTLRAEIEALNVRAHQLGVGLLDGASASIWKQPSA
jgi:MoxR-like ATPase